MNSQKVISLDQSELRPLIEACQYGGFYQTVGTRADLNGRRLCTQNLIQDHFVFCTSLQFNIWRMISEIVLFYLDEMNFKDRGVQGPNKAKHKF